MFCKAVHPPRSLVMKIHQLLGSSWILNFLRTLFRIALAEAQSLIATIRVCPSSPINLAQFYHYLVRLGRANLSNVIDTHDSAAIDTRHRFLVI